MATADRRVAFQARSKRNVTLKAFSLYERDDELINRLADYLGCSRSEAVRSGIRHFAAHLLPNET